MQQAASQMLHGEEISMIVEDLIQTVEKEVEAFRCLHKVLQDQRASIMRGDSETVSESNERVNVLVAETKNLEAEWNVHTRDLAEYLDREGEIRLGELIPLVESQYALRLTELREILQTLINKVQLTNKHNKQLLERSVRSIERYMGLLRGDTGILPSYGPTGRTSRPDSSIYQGIG